jgi:hypothetical protein
MTKIVLPDKQIKILKSECYDNTRKCHHTSPVDQDPAIVFFYLLICLARQKTTYILFKIRLS